MIDKPKAKRTMRNPSRRPTHPGELLREEMIPATGMSEAQFAERLGLPFAELSSILDTSSPITDEIASQLARLFGNGSAIWTRMQDAWDRFPAARNAQDTKQKG